MIEELFANLRQLKRDGQVAWDVDGVCRWSFFFIDEDRDRLVRAGEALARAGYEFVGLLEPDGADDDQATIFLRADRVERHTVDSLMARNADLYKFADAQGVTDYDGMDVGPVDAP